MKLRPEVLPPRARLARRCVAAATALWLGGAAAIYLADTRDRRAETTRRIERLEHDVKWCGRRIDRLRDEQRAIKFIAVAP